MSTDLFMIKSMYAIITVAAFPVFCIPYYDITLIIPMLRLMLMDVYIHQFSELAITIAHQIKDWSQTWKYAVLCLKCQANISASFMIYWYPSCIWFHFDDIHSYIINFSVVYTSACEMIYTKLYELWIQRWVAQFYTENISSKFLFSAANLALARYP